MNICLITTTIFEPRVLALYRAFGPDVQIIIAGDKKTPHDAVKALCKKIGHARYLSPDDQIALGYRSAELVGWNTIPRRNVALLEAIKTKADVIITVDDDNIPSHPSYFEKYAQRFAKPYSGLCVETDRNWFDVGRLILPPTSHRGFPPELRQVDLGMRIQMVTDAKIGVVAGLWLGDPDIDAMTRIVNAPMVHQFSEVLAAGLAVKAGCLTPFNSQNTGYTRELAPLMLLLEGTGRHADIWAAYMAERVMMERGDLVLFGEPYVWQERNKHNLVHDLKEEMLGLEYSLRFGEDLRALDAGQGTPVEQLRRLFEGLGKHSYFPEHTRQIGLAWCDDAQKVIS